MVVLEVAGEHPTVGEAGEDATDDAAVDILGAAGVA